MNKKTGGSFAAKHGRESAAVIDPAVREKLQQAAIAGQLACADAFQLAADLQQSPAEIGKAADLLGIRLVKCQLGLFGYAPEKKMVRPAETVDRALEDAIRVGASRWASDLPAGLGTGRAFPDSQNERERRLRGTEHQSAALPARSILKNGLK